MIVVKLFGGLGNQLFQYAFGKKISLKTNQKLYLEMEYGFKNDPYGRNGVASKETVRRMLDKTYENFASFVSMKTYDVKYSFMLLDIVNPAVSSVIQVILEQETEIEQEKYKNIMKYIKFFIISIPIACLIYVIVLSLCKIKTLCGRK